ncbi:hypothetical protein D9619_007447 [Psilocybe cf. subviscida]|uniref:Uncharacterized protein n=1 Tax=Psilocybe cf. subviscida TaxID=2480587 RepID=A0A8H5B2B4_9AGAR|nr:hypothetical protein D9619_007447 [Psilocybe cf. subviscida]
MALIALEGTLFRPFHPRQPSVHPPPFSIYSYQHSFPHIPTQFMVSATLNQPPLSPLFTALPRRSIVPYPFRTFFLIIYILSDFLFSLLFYLTRGSSSSLILSPLTIPLPSSRVVAIKSFTYYSRLARFPICDQASDGYSEDAALHTDNAHHQPRHESSPTVVDVTCTPDT